MYSTWVSLSLVFDLQSIFAHDGFVSLLLASLLAIATSLQCLIADEEMNDGQGEYHEEDLKRFVDKNATEGDEYEG